MISPERLERYKDFVDTERTGNPYEPRQGLERLMGVLSPDSKGVVLAAMGEDWYGNLFQLRSRVFSFLKELGLPSSIWPLTVRSNWQYIERREKDRQTIDGSLVGLGAVVKKIEPDPSRVFYQRSLAGAELAVPLVQQAVRFVVRAREYAERQKLKGRKPPKFDSMWKIIGALQSKTDKRKPLVVFDTINFLVHHPGNHGEIDLQNGIQMLSTRLSNILSSLGDCGIIDYISPLTDKEGQRGRDWSVYILVNPKAATGLNPPDIYQDIINMKSSFRNRAYLTGIIDYMKEQPDNEYACNVLAKKLNIGSENVSKILSLLTDLNILAVPEPGFKGGEVASAASANDLTHLFYELVCAPAQEVADTLSPLPLRSWQRKELAVYLKNYHEERSHNGPQGGEDARRLLLEILSEARGEMKKSHLDDLYNERAEIELKDRSLWYHLKILLGLGLVEQPRLRYYRLVQK